MDLGTGTERLTALISAYRITFTWCQILASPNFFCDDTQDCTCPVSRFQRIRQRDSETKTEKDKQLFSDFHCLCSNHIVFMGSVDLLSCNQELLLLDFKHLICITRGFLSDYSFLPKENNKFNYWRVCKFRNAYIPPGELHYNAGFGFN